jgi:hypothetical protein
VDQPLALTLTRTAGDRFVSLPILAVPAAIPRAEITLLDTAAHPKDLEFIRAKARGSLRLDVTGVPTTNAQATVRGRVLHVAVQCFSGSGGTVAIARRHVARANRVWAQAGVEIDARSVTDSVPAPAGISDLDHDHPFTGTLTADERKLVGVDPGGPTRSAVARDLNIYYVKQITDIVAGVTYVHEGFREVTDPGQSAIALEAPSVSDLAFGHEIGHALLINWGAQEHSTQRAGTTPSTGWPASNLMHDTDTGTGADLDRTQVTNVVQSVSLGIAPHLALEP